HRIRYPECQAQGCEVSFWMLNGSAHFEECLSNYAECDIEVDAASLPCKITGMRREHSGQWPYYAGGSPLFFGSSSFTLEHCAANGGWFKLVGGTTVVFETNQWDLLPNGVSQLFDLSEFTGVLDASDGNVPVNIPANRLGLDKGTYPVEESSMIAS